METSWKNQLKPHGNPVKRPCKPQIRYKPAWDPEFRLVYNTPRFSYRVLKTVIWGCPSGPVPVRVVQCMADVRAGWVPGTGIRVGRGGAIPVPTHHAARGGPYQRSGPRKPCRGWSGWVGAGRTVFGGGDGQDHPSGPVGHPWAPSLSFPQNAASGP